MITDRPAGFGYTFHANRAPSQKFAGSPSYQGLPELKEYSEQLTKIVKESEEKRLEHFREEGRKKKYTGKALEAYARINVGLESEKVDRHTAFVKEYLLAHHADLEDDHDLLSLFVFNDFSKGSGQTILKAYEYADGRITQELQASQLNANREYTDFAKRRRFNEDGDLIEINAPKPEATDSSQNPQEQVPEASEPGAKRQKK